MGKILPLLLALVGLGIGVGGGVALRSDTSKITASEICIEGEHLAALPHEMTIDESGEPDTGEPDYVKLNNQFVIPLVDQGVVTALVVISLSLEMKSGGPELVYKREPKLRDSFLQVLFDHANSGGFDGNFTTGRKMDILRNALRESAIAELGATVTDVLIADVVKQSV